jgi:hypothetical protein
VFLDKQPLVADRTFVVIGLGCRICPIDDAPHAKDMTAGLKTDWSVGILEGIVFVEGFSANFTCVWIARHDVHAVAEKDGFAWRHCWQNWEERTSEGELVCLADLRAEVVVMVEVMVIVQVVLIARVEVVIDPMKNK